VPFNQSNYRVTASLACRETRKTVTTNSTNFATPCSKPPSFDSRMEARLIHSI